MKQEKKYVMYAGLILLLVLAFWAAVGFVVVHFIKKWW